MSASDQVSTYLRLDGFTEIVGPPRAMFQTEDGVYHVYEEILGRDFDNASHAERVLAKRVMEYVREKRACFDHLYFDRRVVVWRKMPEIDVDAFGLLHFRCRLATISTGQKIAKEVVDA
jgi:hypothetical protein